MSEDPKQQFGKLALEHSRELLPLQVVRSAAGFYIGTTDDNGPCSRESVEYWPKRKSAEAALHAGRWIQRREP